MLKNPTFCEGLLPEPYGQLIVDHPYKMRVKVMAKEREDVLQEKLKASISILNNSGLSSKEKLQQTLTVGYVDQADDVDHQSLFLDAHYVNFIKNNLEPS